MNDLCLDLSKMSRQNETGQTEPEIVEAESSSTSKCTCCPYGYHIHVDFVEFSKSSLQAQIQELFDPQWRWRNERRQMKADWAEVEMITTETNKILASANHSFDHSNVIVTTNASDEFRQLQEKVKLLTQENWKLKCDQLPLAMEALILTKNSVAVQVNQIEFQDDEPDPALEMCIKSDAEVQAVLYQDQNVDKNSFNSSSAVGRGDDMVNMVDTAAVKNVSRIPRLKSPMTPREQRKTRKKSIPRNSPRTEMKFELDKLNEALLGGYSNEEVRETISLVSEKWLQLTAMKTSVATKVEQLLGYIHDLSPQLQSYILNMTDQLGNTALHYAVSHGNFDVVSILLDSDVCDPDLQNKAGYTSLMLIALAKIVSDKDRNVVRRLLSLGNVNARAAQHGQTALMLVVAQGQLEAARLLVETGADVNLQDEDGSTALMCAVEHGHGHVVRYLLSLPSCDPRITDSDGYTALEVAMEAGNKELAVLLYACINFSDASRIESKN